MYNNIGEKIKTLAEIICIIGIVASIIAAIVMFSNSEIGLGFLLLLLAPLLFWISSFTLYGFGEIIVLLKQNIDKQTEIIREIKGTENSLSKTIIVNNSPKQTTNGGSIPTNNIALKEYKTSNETNNTTHTWRCVNCNKMISELPCPYCGDNFN